MLFPHSECAEVILTNFVSHTSRGFFMSDAVEVTEPYGNVIYERNYKKIDLRQFMKSAPTAPDGQIRNLLYHEDIAH